jgi:hypothetical protein
MIQYSLVRQYLFGVTKAHWRVLPQLTVPVGAGAVFILVVMTVKHHLKIVKLSNN